MLGKKPMKTSVITGVFFLLTWILIFFINVYNTNQMTQFRHDRNGVGLLHWKDAVKKIYDELELLDQSSASSGGTGIQEVVLTLNEAQIKAWANGSEIELVPSPGVGKTVWPRHFKVYRAGATQLPMSNIGFSMRPAGASSVYWANNTLILSNPGPDWANLRDNTEANWPSDFGQPSHGAMSNEDAEMINKALVLKNESGAMPSDYIGAGVAIIVQYEIVDTPVIL